MKLSTYIVEFLAKRGVTHVFGYAGGTITHILDSISARRDIFYVSTYHEQGAAFAAEGYARIKNDIGVAIATSGPGATNLITGIGNAYFDSIPCLYITGQVNTYEYKGDLKVRQKGFQELEIVKIVKPITKYATRITDPNRIQYELQKALDIATSGRKGPVLLDIPMNIQRAEIDHKRIKSYKKISSNPQKNPLSDNLRKKIIRMLNNCERPVVLVGGGVRLANATKQLKEFLEKTKIPFVSSLMGLDACDRDLQNYCGMMGAYGNRCSNFTIANSDLIISLGSRLPARQTGTKIEHFARAAKIIRVEIDENELKNKIKKDEVAVSADIGEFLEEIKSAVDSIKMKDLSFWLEKVKIYKTKYFSLYSKSNMDPNRIMHTISEYCLQGDIICLDVGQNQMWAAQSFNLKKDQRILATGGMAAMGFSLPAAIGAYYASPKSRIISFSGDGGIQINIQELQVLKRNKIPIKVIILNNHSLGMISHFQKIYFNGICEGSIKGYSAPDFCKIAKAYGLDAVSINSFEEIEKIKKHLKSKKSLIIEINFKQETYVYPKLGMNRPIEDQEPLLNRKEFNSNMLIKPIKYGKN